MAKEMIAMLLAGGQGTRLGFDKPKGMFNIGVTKPLYIFQKQIRQEDLTGLQSHSNAAYL